MKPAVPWTRYVAFFAIACGGCAADLWTKGWMFARYPMNGRIWWLWHGVFGYQTNLNPGALFGFGPGFWPVFAALSVAAAAAIFVYLFLFGAARQWLPTAALALVTAGIVGNLYDRLAFHGLGPDGQTAVYPVAPVHCVRDFIVMFQVGQWHWPNYNIADSALVCGVLLLVWHAMCTTPAGKEMTNDEVKMPKE